jgi:hypothetical protein
MAFAQFEMKLVIKRILGYAKQPGQHPTESE